MFALGAGEVCRVGGSLVAAGGGVEFGRVRRGRVAPDCALVKEVAAISKALAAITCLKKLLLILLSLGVGAASNDYSQSGKALSHI